MSEHTASGGLGRVLAHLTVRTHQIVREQDRQYQANAPREIEQQFQFQINGVSSPLPVFKEVQVKFRYAFFQGADRRETTLLYPQIKVGSHTNPATAIHVTVTEWLLDETNGSIIGAMVAIGASGPGESFEGIAHVTFQGLGMFVEDDISEEGKLEEEELEVE